MANETTTISFVISIDLKRLVEQWARDEDRSLSATLRKILTQEAHRRQEHDVVDSDE